MLPSPPSSAGASAACAGGRSRRQPAQLAHDPGSTARGGWQPTLLGGIRSCKAAQAGAGSSCNGILPANSLPSLLAGSRPAHSRAPEASAARQTPCQPEGRGGRLGTGLVPGVQLRCHAGTIGLLLVFQCGASVPHLRDRLPAQRECCVLLTRSRAVATGSCWHPRHRRPLPSSPATRQTSSGDSTAAWAPKAALCQAAGCCPA